MASNPFTSKLLLEGPLKKYKEGEGTASFILSGRTSYLEKTSKSIYSYVDTAGLPYNFSDFYGKVSLNGVNGSKLNLFGFNFTDQVKYSAPAALNWNSAGAGGSFVLVPDESSVLIDGAFAYSNYKIGDQVEIIMNQSMGTKAVFLGYFLPFIFMMITMLTTFSISKNEALTALFTIMILAIYYLLLFVFKKQISNTFSFKIQ